MLDAAALRAFPDPRRTPAACGCATLVCPGWESIPQPLGAPQWRHAGTLRDPDVAEPTVAEWPGADYWSPDAAIAPHHFPYNRCTAWACVQCARGVLQYTEYGGYYVDHRVREIDPAKVVDDVPA
jgi:hypothetical protein